MVKRGKAVNAFKIGDYHIVFPQVKQKYLFLGPREEIFPPKNASPNPGLELPAADKTGIIHSV